jgi:hypothetical protein
MTDRTKSSESEADPSQSRATEVAKLPRAATGDRRGGGERRHAAPPRVQPDSTFITQLIATASLIHQASPADVQAHYRSVAGQDRPATRPSATTRLA